ncbi:MAG: hypothetical protein NVSMB65_16900 [Chloroflexota bacterium]
MTIAIDARAEALPAASPWEAEADERARTGPNTEPHLLLLLTRGSAHGYDLLAQLAALGFRSGTTDQGAVYRTLRRLEEAGCVTSWWETGASGPARRIYEITAHGREALHHWSVVLRERKERLERFLDLYSAWTAEQEEGYQRPARRHIITAATPKPLMGG